MSKNNGLEGIKPFNFKLCIDGEEHDMKGFAHANREDLEKRIEYDPDTIYRDLGESDEELRKYIKNIIDEGKTDSNTKITKINPVEFLEGLNQGKPNKLLSKIKFDEELITNFKIIKRFNCDGTFALIDNGILNAINQAISEAPYYFLVNSGKIDFGKLKDINFVMGEITLKEEFGTVSLKCGEYPGEHVTVEVPIKAVFIF